MSVSESVSAEEQQTHLTASAEDSIPVSVEDVGAVERSAARCCPPYVWHRIVKLLYSLVEGPVTQYSTALREAPLCTKAITSCIVALLGEVIGASLKSKSRADRKDPILDGRRMAIFGFYGLAITGPFFHFWYGLLEDLVQRVHLTTDGQITYCEGISSGSAPVKSYSPLLANALKLTINQLVMTPPFLLFTLAYIQFCLTLDTSKTMASVKRTFAVALLTNWKVWTVAQAVNFQLVPLQYRVLFGNLVALWWNIYLSLVTPS